MKRSRRIGGANALQLIALVGLLVMVIVMGVTMMSDQTGRGVAQVAQVVDQGLRPPAPPAPRAPPAPPMRPRPWVVSQEEYETIGFLEGGGETRPLFGRRSHTRRYRWHYSTTNDSQSDISALKLPVSSVAQNRKCTSEIGCEELYDDDAVKVPGSVQEWRVRLYEKHFG